MQLKSVDLVHPISYRSSVDMTLLADPRHGDTLEFDPANSLFILAISHTRGECLVPMSNVKRFTPFTKAELEAQANPPPLPTVVQPLQAQVAAINDTVKFAKKDGRVVETKG